jgi:hypothetical protein
MKTLVAVLLSASSFLAASQALADKPTLTAEQLAKARESASQLNPPVDFDAMLEEIDTLGVECKGNLIKRIEIHLCRQKIENAKKQKNIDRLEAENARLDKETAKHIRELQRRIRENK